MRLAELILLKLDGRITSHETEVLNNVLEGNTEAQQVYLDFMNVCSGLSNHSTVSEMNVPVDFETEDDLGDFDLYFWQELAEEERNAPAIEIEPEKPQKVYLPTAHVEKQPRQINKFFLYTAIVSAAALLFIIIFVSVAPPASQEVATISDSINAEWSYSKPIKEGIRLSTHSEPIHLNRGIVKLVTDENVEVILEGPTEFRFLSYSELKLNYGKLFAHVSDQGLGFSVSTPNSKVVDLGTEFGVLCQINGDTEVYMYKGKASLFAGEKNENKTSEILQAGSARKIDCKNRQVESIALDDDAIVRTIDSKSKMIWKGRPVNLADIVGGGDGFTGGIPLKGIEVTSGNVITSMLTDSTVEGPIGYVAVPDNRYVDGVFVPGITGETTQISSDGTMITDIPKTSGSLWGYIFNGAMHKGATTAEHALRLNGVVMGTKENPAITIHSNQGITFDLNKIRQTVPGLNITSFDSLIGISETVRNALSSEQGYSPDAYDVLKKVFEANCSTVEFWVYLDGKLVYHKKAASDRPAEKIAIPINADNRFLTLAVTESDDTQGYDWAMFARPELKLESVK